MSKRKRQIGGGRSLHCYSWVVAAGMALHSSANAKAADATWDGDSLVGTPGDGHTWADANNWTSGGIDDAAPPDQAPGDDLLFGGGSVGVITLGTNRFANSLSFSAAFALDNSESLNVLNIATGDVTLSEDQKPVTINAILNSSNGLTVNGSDTQSTLVLRGNNLYTGTTSLSDCTLQVQADANLGKSSNGIVMDDADLVAMNSFATDRNIICGGQSATISVPSGITLTEAGLLSSSGQMVFDGTGTLNLSGGCILSALNVSGGKVIFDPTTKSALTVGGLTLNTAKLDLTNADMIIQNGAATNIQALLASGFNGGKWNGSGIVSSIASSNTSHITTLGYLLNNTGSNQPIISTFDGQNVSDTDVLVKYTYMGDANLDGKVDGSDYSRIDNAVVLDRTNPSAATGWYNGDFNYDGVINGSDYTLIDNAFNSQGASLAGLMASPPACIATQLGAISSVPEPSSVAIFFFFGLLATRARSGSNLDCSVSPLDIRRHFTKLFPPRPQ